MRQLATNAVKYGALSNQNGRIHITWSAEEEFLLRWTELGGPAVVVPDRRGFGSRLIEQGLSHEFGALVELKFERQGVVCTIRAPLDEMRALVGSSGARP